MKTQNLKAEHILFCETKKITSVHQSEISKYEASNGWVDVFTVVRKEPFLIIEKFEHCEEDMKELGGFRINKSVISMLQYVTSINLQTSELTMEDGCVHPIAKDKLYDVVYEWIKIHKHIRGRLPIALRRLIEEKENELKNQKPKSEQ